MPIGGAGALKNPKIPRLLRKKCLTSTLFFGIIFLCKTILFQTVAQGRADLEERSKERLQNKKTHTELPSLVNDTEPTADTERAFWTFFKLMDLSKYFRAYCYKPVLDLGFSLNEIDVMLSLTKHPERNTVKGISETMHLSRGMISQAVESLRQRGLVAVDHDEKDRRSLLITLNDAASPILETLTRGSMAFVQEIIRGVGQEQLQEVYRVVSQVYTNKEKMKALPSDAGGNI